jgi:hypothetical protein
MAKDIWEVEIKTQGKSGGGASAIDSAFLKSIQDMSAGMRDAGKNAQILGYSLMDAEKKIAASLKKTSDSMGKFSRMLDTMVAANSRRPLSEKPTMGDYSKKTSASSPVSPRNMYYTQERMAKAMETLVTELKKNTDKLGVVAAPPAKASEDTGNDKGGKKSNTSDSSTLKKILAAAGVGSIVKEYLNAAVSLPAATAAQLITGNITQGPSGFVNSIVNQSIQSTQGKTSAILTGFGAAAGGIAGSLLPGIGTLAGAGTGGAISHSLYNTFYGADNQKKAAALQRYVEMQNFENLASQRTSLGTFKYKVGGFSDPYFAAESEFAKGFSPYGGGHISNDSLQNIIASGIAQGFSNFKELGSILGQIARYSPHNNFSTVLGAINQSGLSPDDAASRILSLVQTGQYSPNSAAETLLKTAQRGSQFSAMQLAYQNSPALSRFTSQLAVRAFTGVDLSALAMGDPGGTETGKARRIYERYYAELKKNPNAFPQEAIAVNFLQQAGVTYASLGGADIVSPGRALSTPGGKFSPSKPVKDATDLATQIYSKEALAIQALGGFATALQTAMQNFASQQDLTTGPLDKFRDAVDSAAHSLEKFAKKEIAKVGGSANGQHSR